MLSILYSSLIIKYKLATWLYSFWNTKAKKRILGLRNQNDDLDHRLSTISHQRILVHCSSHGEFEQALPIIQWVLERTNFDIVISFFSSSGYENCELPQSRCIKCYLPFDLKSEMNAFLSIINPSKVIITKNEWWWNLLFVLKSKKIDTYLISSTIRNGHYFIKYPLTFFKERLSAFSSIFVLNKKSKIALNPVFTGEVLISGDTRKDRVRNIKNNIIIKKTTRSNIIYGSVWIEDVPTIKQIIKELPNYNHYIYPHDLSIENVTTISSLLDCESVNTISNLSGIFVIDSMGQLKKDYALAQIAYIGGGFGEGIHNILEASVYNIAAIHGPRFAKSEETKELVELGVAFPVSNNSEIKPILRKLKTNECQEEVRIKLIGYFSDSKSATITICTNIFE